MNYEKENKKIHLTLKENMKLIEVGKTGTKEENELIFYTVIHLLKKMIDDLIKRLHIGDC